MFKIYPFQSCSLIGLDVQPDAARLIQLKKTRHGYQVERIAMRPIPAGLLVAGKIQQREDLSAVLTEWFELLGINQQFVAISLPLQAVRIQRIVLPAVLSTEDIQTEILTHMQHDMPGLNESLCIDFNVLPPMQVGYIDVLFTAVRETYLSSYVDCIQSAGLKVKIVDVDVYALMRAVNIMQLTYAILHIKTTITELLIIHQQEVIFHRQWETGEMVSWIEQLNTHLQIYFALPNKKNVEKIVISGAEEYVNELMLHSFLREYSNIIMNFTFERKCSADKPQNIGDLQLSSDYLIAYGLALRQVPAW